jgi:c-di-GMP-binding flagellar brake protein YcgR
MSTTMQELVLPQQIKEIVKSAAIRLTPAALTCRLRDTWQTYRSRFLGLRQEQIFLEYGHGEDGQVRPQFSARQRIGVAFKWHNRKYVFSTAIREINEVELEGQGPLKAMLIQWPDEMFRLQRRAFLRATVPPGRSINASFWAGGLTAVANGRQAEPMYRGQVLDLSAGGLSVRLGSAPQPPLKLGAVLGVRLEVDEGGGPLEMDAQFRHSQEDPSGPNIGIQIMGLTETPEGRSTLERLAQIIRHLSRGPRQRAAG